MSVPNLNGAVELPVREFEIGVKGQVYANGQIRFGAIGKHSTGNPMHPLQIRAILLQYLSSLASDEFAAFMKEMEGQEALRKEILKDAPPEHFLRDT